LGGEIEEEPRLFWFGVELAVDCGEGLEEEIEV
jgi:hypothetical protein